MLDVLLSFNPINNKLVIDSNNFLTVKKKSFFDRINIFWKPKNERLQTVADHIFKILDDKNTDVGSLFNTQDKLARVFQKANYIFCKLDHKTKNGDQYQNKSVLKQIDFFHRLNVHEIQQKESTLASTTQKIEELQKQNLQTQKESQKLTKEKNQLASEIQAQQSKLNELQCDTVIWTNNGYLLINSSLYPKLQVLHNNSIQKLGELSETAMKTLEALHENSPEKLRQLMSFKYIHVPFDSHIVANFFEYTKNPKLMFAKITLDSFKEIHAYLGGDHKGLKLIEKSKKAIEHKRAYSTLRTRMHHINQIVFNLTLTFDNKNKLIYLKKLFELSK